MSKVAIITRTKDRPLFLPRAIESVARQTYRDYIHVIVNDGGDEQEVQSVVNAASDDAKETIKLFHRPKASGAPDTIFSESIDRVESMYVAIHDDDDSWHPEFLERSLELLETGSKGVLSRTDRVYERLESSEIKPIKSKPYMKNLKSVTLERQCFENQLTPISFIFERATYEKIGKYDDSLSVAGDWEFGIRFLMDAKVDYLDPGFALAHYHRRVNIEDHSYSAHNHSRVVDTVKKKYLNNQDPKMQQVGRLIEKVHNEHRNKHKILRRLVPKSLLKYRRKFIN